MPTSGQEQTPFSEKGTLVCVQGGIKEEEKETETKKKKKDTEII